MPLAVLAVMTALPGAVSRRLDDHGLVGRARALRRLERDNARTLRQRPVNVRVLVHVLARGGDRRLRLRIICGAPERVRAGQLDARSGCTTSPACQTRMG